VQVFEPLALLNTNSKHWNSANSLLVTPSTSHHIQSNRDGVAQEMVYEGWLRCMTEPLSHGVYWNELAKLWLYFR